jgi:hypothetical protein
MWQFLLGISIGGIGGVCFMAIMNMASHSDMVLSKMVMELQHKIIMDLYNSLNTIVKEHVKYGRYVGEEIDSEILFKAKDILNSVKPKEKIQWKE